MKTSRRGFLGAGAVGAIGGAIGGAFINQPTPADSHTTHPKKRFVFADAFTAPRVRKSVWDLTDDEVRTLCKAVGYARNMYLVNDPRKWENYAKIHAWHCTGEAGADPHGVLQVHWSWHFLPWHRGYIYFLERILAQALKDQGLDDTTFAYPFWDWTVHQEIPNTKERVARGLASPLWGYDLTQENMVSADTLGFDNLALFNGNRGPSLAKSRMTPDNENTEESKAHIVEASHYLSAEYINLALRLPWEQFGGKVEIERTSQGILEAGPHNDGHDWCGTRLGSNRDMGTLKFAAQDPIFFMHHANIDRIFDLYRGEMPDLNGPWGDQTYDYTDADGSTVTVSVKEIMTEMTRGVVYATPSDNALVAGLTKQETKQYWLPVDRLLPATAPLVLTVDTPMSVPEHANDSIVLLELETGPIVRHGRATIKVFIDNEYVGRVKMLDGDAPATSDTTTHTFVMTAHKFGDLTRFVSDPQHFTLTLVPTGLREPTRIKRIGLRFLH